MPNTIIVSQNLQIFGDSSLSEENSIICEALDKVEVTVPHNTADMEVNLFTGSAADVQVLAIKANQYLTGLAYKVHADTNPSVALDAMQVFAGAGEIALMGFVPDKLFFSNEHLSSDAIITIFVGRKATL